MSSQHNAQFSVMTWNIYQGADLTPILTAKPEDIPIRVTEVFRQFLATNFQKRANAIVKQIVLKEPDIIGLQEAVTWELIPPNSKKVVFNFVDILLCELLCKGLRYRIAAENRNSEAELPSSTGNIIRLSDRDVILIRHTSKIKIDEKYEGNYQTNLQIQLAGQPFTVLRGWSALDACARGNKFRIVSTHLEPLSPEVQVAQGNELLTGPANTELPLVLIGDYNSNANGTGTQTYVNLIAAGFKDAWSTIGKGEGVTSYQDADLLNAFSKLKERIDLILFSNNNHWRPLEIEVIGAEQLARTKLKLWPSDHGGVYAKLKLLNKEAKN